MDDGAPERLQLDAGSWVDVWRGWLDDGEATFRELARTLPWAESRLWRYDHYVTEPRLGTSVRSSELARYPVLKDAHLLLRKHYNVEFMGPALAYYRNGRDALGTHRDRDMRYCSDTLVAILTFGAQRPWHVTPQLPAQRRSPALSGRLQAAPVMDLSPANGDLFVLGGRAQADWLHGVPPVQGLIEGRISAQWRWTSRTGPPERGGSYRAPRNYSR